MQISENGKNLIKSFEGCSLVAYKVLPSEQYWTIGYGHYGPDVYEGMRITQEQANNLFDKDIQKYSNAVNNFPFTWKLNQNEFDSLVSFCYNLGTGILEDFRGLTREEIIKEIPLYCNSGGVRLEGLVRRRKAELELFNTPCQTLTNNNTEYEENGIFYPSELIYFRNAPYVSDSNPIQGNYTSGECVIYDRVFIGNNYVWISWLSATNNIRRYMPIRTYENGVYGEIWGIIE